MQNERVSVIKSCTRCSIFSSRKALRKIGNSKKKRKEKEKRKKKFEMVDSKILEIFDDKIQSTLSTITIFITTINFIF